jgi:ABC-type glycerol-3-phosphate transport system substrate-binding protein
MSQTSLDSDLSAQQTPVSRKPWVWSKTGSDRLVIGELEEWIRSGRLRVGQRLPSVKKLQKLLGVGQKSIESAKAVLEQRGWIETRNRSGSYVLADAGTTLGGAAKEDTLHSSRAIEFYIPLQPKKTISIYTMDCNGRSQSAWSNVIGRFQSLTGVEAELLTPSDGHLMGLLNSREIDVVHTTQEILDAIALGAQCEWMDIPVPQTLPGDLPDFLSGSIQAGEHTKALPFGMTVPYLFVNRSLGRDLKLPDDVPSNPTEFLRMIKATSPKALAQGCQSLGISRLEHLIMMGGGIVAGNDASVRLKESNARLCVDELLGSRLPLYHDTEIPELFAKGTMLFARHWSFTCSELLEKSGFEWEAVPVPHLPNSRDQAFLSVIAVAKTGGANESAMRLASHLIEKESQQEFARAGGNLPVRVSSLPAMLDAGSGHLSAATLRRVLRDADIYWPHRSWRAAEHVISGSLTRRILEGDISAPEAIAEITHGLASSAETPA